MVKVNDQRGLVSMVIVVVLMLVITIMTLSFSSNVRNEQRQTLDRQLNTQAYYAAESGVNYGAKIVREQLERPGVTTASLRKDSCAPTVGGLYDDTLELNSATLKVSCLLINTAPGSLVYTLDPAAQSKIFPVKPSAAIDRFQIEWSPTPGSVANCDQTTNLESSSAWDCPYGLIRLDLVRTSNVSRQGLAGNNFSNMFMPVNGAGVTANFDSGTANAFGGPATQGVRYRATCDATNCRATIMLPGLTTEEFYARVQTLYRATNLTFRALNGSTEVSLLDAQIVVDATGKSQDVLRRIQTRIPLVGQAVHADYGLQTRDNICKAFTAYNPSVEPSVDGRGGSYSNTAGC